MTIHDEIIDEILSALFSGKIDKYECLTGEEILSSDQRRIIEQAKFTYSPLGKAFGKKLALEVLKTNTQKLTIKNVIPENTLSEDANNEPNKIKEI